MSNQPGSDANVAISRGRILHCEDSQTVAVIVARFLRAKGYQVESVTNGKEALAKILAQPATLDLIIMDYSMPELDGLECVRVARERGFVGKILVFTDSLPHGMEQQFLALGVSRILYKSSDFASLHRVIQDLLNPTETKSK
jgi:CheY-like chemotaxis protein